MLKMRCFGSWQSKIHHCGRVFKASRPKTFPIHLCNHAHRRSLVFAKTKAHLVGKSIRRIVATLDDSVLCYIKVNSIGFVLPSNILTLVTVKARDIDNKGFVANILLDRIDDDVFLVDKSFSNDALQSFP